MQGVMFWALVLGFFGGVSAALAGDASYVITACMFCVALCGVIVMRCVSGRMASILLMVVFISIGSGVGMIRTLFVARIESSSVLRCEHMRSVATGMVIAEPDRRDARMNITLALHTISCASTTYATSEHVIAAAPPHTDVTYGDQLTVVGTIRRPVPFQVGTGVFDYPDFLRAKSIVATMDFARVTAREPPTALSYVGVILQLKKMFITGIQSVLPEPESSLATGILIGDQRSVGPALQQDFQRASLTHILVLSGYNITVVVDWLFLIVRYAPRIVQGSSVIALTFVFVVLSGGASSAVRAALMTSIVLVARMYAREFNALRALGAVSVCMVLWQPLVLWYDPSFQLSCLAILGLIMYGPICARVLWCVPTPWGLREIIASTCATQLFVAPFLMMTSGTISIVAIPANVTVLTSMPFAMASSFVAGIAGMVLGSYGVIGAVPAYGALRYILEVTQWWASLSFATVPIQNGSWYGVYAWYAGLMIVWLYTKHEPVEPAHV